jgi:hypothetical protein
LNRAVVFFGVVLGMLPVAAGVRAQTSGRGGVSTVRHDAPTAFATAILPGFETLDDGSTRLFVDLSAPISYETKSAKGSIIYVLKKTVVARRNNCNALVTEFFNTPARTARLVPHGHDLWFVVDLRDSVPPAVSVDAKAGGGATLSIRFPKGDYLPPQPAAEAPSRAEPEEPGAPTSATPAARQASPAARPTPRPHGGSGHGRRRAGGT